MFEQLYADYAAEQNAHADREYAAFFATLSDETLAIGLANIAEQIELLPYRSFRVNIAERGAELRDEQRRFKAEIARRSTNA